MRDHPIELKWSASGPSASGMESRNVQFSSGNSGNVLYEAVVKLGDGCQQEGAFCVHLGGIVAPAVFAVIPNGYVMERLTPAAPTPSLLREIEELLEAEVWNRPALPISNDVSWVEKLNAYGICVPKNVIETDSCLVHGDPTASNALIRGAGQLIMGDPRPPRDFIPQNRETDMGRILQSYMGWEVAAYHQQPIRYEQPKFMDDTHLRDAAIFWCGAAAARIEHLERSRMSRPNILEWCSWTRRICNV